MRKQSVMEQLIQNLRNGNMYSSISVLTASTLNEMEKRIAAKCIICQGFSHGYGSKPLKCPALLSLLKDLRLEGKELLADIIKSELQTILAKLQLESQLKVEEEKRMEQQTQFKERRKQLKEMQKNYKNRVKILESIPKFNDLL